MKYSSKNTFKITRVVFINYLLVINFQCINFYLFIYASLIFNVFFDVAFIFKNPLRRLVTNKLARELSTRVGKTRSSEARE